MGKKGLKKLKTYFSKLKSAASDLHAPAKPAAAVSRLLLCSVCRNPRTSSLAAAGDRSATLSDVDRLLLENFRSLYDDDDDEDGGGASAPLPAPADRGWVAVRTMTRDPCEEFRRSMMGAMGSRRAGDQGLDWEFMEEMLLCMLEINDRTVHGYVLKAFADLTVDESRRRAPAAMPERGKKDD